MILHNFYEIISQEHSDNQLTAVIQINPGHEIFEGHFPGQPVVPGVCMVQITKELLEQQIGRKLQLSQAAQIKFLGMIVPQQNEHIDIKISWRPTDRDTLVTQATWSTVNGVTLKFNGNFEPVST